MPMTAAILDDAALEQGAVADDHVAADDRRQPGSAVDDRVVLHRGALADLDAIEIAAQHGAEPDARTRPDDDVADERRGRGEEDVVRDLRGLSFEGENRRHVYGTASVL